MKPNGHETFFTPMHERTRQGAVEWLEGVHGLDGYVRAFMDGLTAFRKPMPCFLPQYFTVTDMIGLATTRKMKQPRGCRGLG